MTLSSDDRCSARSEGAARKIGTIRGSFLQTWVVFYRLFNVSGDQRGRSEGKDANAKPGPCGFCHGIADKGTVMVYSPQLGVAKIPEFRHLT
jgi:hypothetical protein